MSRTLQFSRPQQSFRAVVSFDATGTLLHCPRLFEIYAEILNKHGATQSTN